VQEGYVWYDVAQWVPEKDHYFWIGPGRFDLKNGATSAIRGLYIDKLELSRVEQGIIPGVVSGSHARR
jgi:hypothetical protein